MTRPVRVAADAETEVAMTVNGTAVTVSVPPRMHLADALRERLGLTGTHLGCEHGVCGMCTVLVDGEAARACLLLAVQCGGAQVVTVEGLGGPDELHPLQQAFSAHHGLQCGFCTPGFLLSSYDLLAHEPGVDPGDLPEELSGVLCRCTGYRGILAAVADVAGRYPDGVPAPLGCGTPRTLVGRTGTIPASRAVVAAESAPASPAQVHLPTGEPSAVVQVAGALQAGADAVWAVLADVRRLTACLPGAELVEDLGGDRYRGRARAGLGPVRLAFEGFAEVVERDPAGRRMHLLAQGTDAGGSATVADIRLYAVPEDAGSRLHAHAALHLSGRVAQFGRALAGDVGRRMFEEFATAVDAEAAGKPAPPRPRPLRLAAGIVRDLVAAAVRRVRERRRAEG